MTTSVSANIIGLFTIKSNKEGCILRTCWSIIESFDTVLKYRQYAKKQFKLFDKKHRQLLFESFIKNLNYKIGDTVTISILNSYGITSADVFCDELIENIDYIQAHRYFKDHADVLIPAKAKKLTKRQQQGKALVDAGMTHMTMAEVADYESQDENERLLVIRNRYGLTEPLIYTFEGSWDELAIRSFRMEYAYVTGSNYYEASPILYSTCIKDPERFYKTCQDEYNDDIIAYDKENKAC